ncbi:hypothetical protein [Frankia canadensis]|uniref:hypothetical protein n=1 Tax=Frankia canadensis TaxID=1836972 RepID=UPI0014023E8E
MTSRRSAWRSDSAGLTCLEEHTEIPQAAQFVAQEEDTVDEERRVVRRLEGGTGERDVAEMVESRYAVAPVSHGAQRVEQQARR